MGYKMLSKCPYCGSEDIGWAESGFEPEAGWIIRHCDTCHEDWYEVYPFSHCEDMRGERLGLTNDE